MEKKKIKEEDFKDYDDEDIEIAKEIEEENNKIERKKQIKNNYNTQYQKNNYRSKNIYPEDMYISPKNNIEENINFHFKLAKIILALGYASIFFFGVAALILLFMQPLLTIFCIIYAVLSFIGLYITKINIEWKAHLLKETYENRKIKKISLIILFCFVLLGVCGCGKVEYDENFDYNNYVIGYWNFESEDNSNRILKINKDNSCEETENNQTINNNCKYFVYKNYLIIISDGIATEEYIKDVIDNKTDYDTEKGIFTAYVIDKKDNSLKDYDPIMKDNSPNKNKIYYVKNNK